MHKLNKMKVLVLGSTGMLGHVLCDVLEAREDVELVNVARRPFNSETVLADVSNDDRLKTVIKEAKPQVIVNCVGVLIKGSSDNPANAILLNGRLPHLLSQIASEIGARVVTVSTDCVFSGKRGNYRVDDFRDADDTYGRSKSLGELMNEQDTTIRTSIIGPELKEVGEGLFDWFMRQSGEISGYSKAIWSGVTTLELARIISDHFIFDHVPGLFQVSPEKGITKLDLLGIINDQFQKNISIQDDPSKAVDKSLVKSADFVEVSNYPTQIEEMHDFMTKRKDRYAKYFA